MNKVKQWLMKGLINKYAGVAVSTGVGYSVSLILTKLADAPAWLIDIVLTTMNAGVVEGQPQITELNETSLTLVLTPIFTIAVQAAVNSWQAYNVEKIQKANGDVVDGWVGKETIAGATKKDE